jgi:hypoxia up-regulated 1
MRFNGPRRRPPSILVALLSFLVLFAHTASAASAVLGIDLGTEYIKAALVKPGIPLEIVLTKDSKRKETAAVAFKPLNSKLEAADPKVFPERVYGGDAVALSARYPGDVYRNLKPLLGLQFKDDDLINGYRARYPALRMQEAAERGTVGFQSDSFKREEEPFIVEELLAMELKNIRANVVALAGKGTYIKDVVITIPSFYTAEEKRALSLAVDLAGLRLLALISDGLSIGLNYATSRTFPTVSDGGKPEYHLVYDMGAGSTTATLLRFQGKIVKDIGKYNKTVQEVQVLGNGWDRTLGGDALNDIIVEDMVQKFVSTPQMKTMALQSHQVKEHGRTMAKLWKEAERIRQVLSANTETSSSFEGLLYDDVSFKYKLTRTDFENLASAYSARVGKPIMEALDSAKLDISDIESIILHGGAVRTPFVQRQLEATIGSADKVRTNVNSDEAAVFGAAFKAAGISPSFRVKEIRAGGIAGYAVGAAWSSDGKARHQKLFIPTSQTGAEKQVSFKVVSDFEFTLYEQVPSNSEGLLDKPIVKIQTSNLTASVQQLIDKYNCVAADISTQFAIRLNPTDGLPEVLRGSVSCEAMEKKGGMVDGVKDFLGFGAKKNDQEPLQGEAVAEPSVVDPGTESSTSSSSKGSKTEDSSASKEVGGEDKAKKIQSIHVEFSTSVAGLPPVSAENLRRMKDRLTAFDSSDRSRIKREEALNTLEAFTYKARDFLEDEGFIAASTEKQRTEIEGEIKAVSDWLYGDGADANRETLKARLDHLRDLVDPIQRRKEEAGKRPDELKALQDALEQAKAMIGLVSQNLEAASIADEIASASAASAAAAESDTSATPSPSTTDDFADLDDDPTPSPSPTPSPTPEMPPLPNYSPEDLTALTSAQESVQTWLDAKLAEQGKLSPAEDPVLLSADLTTKSKELNQIVIQLLQKQMQPPPGPKSSKTKKSPQRSKTMTVNPADNTRTSEETNKEGEKDPLDEIFKHIPDGMDQATADRLRATVEERLRAESGNQKVEKESRDEDGKWESSSSSFSSDKSKSKSKSKGKVKVNVKNTETKVNEKQTKKEEKTDKDKKWGGRDGDDDGYGHGEL